MSFATSSLRPMPMPIAAALVCERSFAAVSSLKTYFPSLSSSGKSVLSRIYGSTASERLFGTASFATPAPERSADSDRFASLAAPLYSGEPPISAT